MNQIVIQNPEPLALRGESVPMVEAAKSLAIMSAADREQAAATERGLTKFEQLIAAHYKPIKQAIDASKKTVLEQERAYLAPVQEAKGIVKAKELAWDLEQQRIADEERRKVEAALREKAEAERKLEAAALKAQGDKKAAKELLKAPIVVPQVKIEAPVVAGQSIRETWTAEVIDMGAFIAAAGKNPELHHLLEPNEQAIKRMAREQKAGMNVPGVRVWCEKGLTTRA